MKAILKKFWLYLPMVLLFGAVGCSDDDDTHVEADPASITIDNVTTTSSSVRFTLTPQKAVRYTYEVALVGGTGDVKEIANGDASTQEVKDLEADKAYFIKAVAYNEDGKPSEEARHEFRTTALASVAIEETIEVTVSSAKVTFVPTNATSISFACYATDNKPAELQWTKIEGNEKYTAEFTELTDDTDYTVEAFATNAEGDSEHQTATFKTLALPSLEMALNADALTAHSAALTFTPANAEGFAYAYYKAEEHPEEPVFVTVAAGEETVVTLNRLAAKTAYMVEAYAFSGDYKTEVIKLDEAFTTPEATEGLEVNIISNGKVAYAEMYMNPEKITGYYYSSQFVEEGGWLDYEDAAAWWKDEQNNAWWGLNPTKQDYTMMSSGLTLGSNYSFYAIEQVEGQWDESTLREIKFTAGAAFTFGEVEPEITCTPAATNIAFDAVCSDNAVVLLSCIGKKADVEAAEGGAEGYFSTSYNYVSKMIDMPAFSLTHTGLAPRTDYYVMTATLNRDNRMSKLNVQQIKTSAVETVDVDTEVSFESIGFVGAKVNFSIEYADAAVSQIRYKFLTKEDFENNYDGDEEAVKDELFGGISTQTQYISSKGENIYGGQASLYNLMQATEYKLFATPILPDAQFGNVAVIDFSTNDLGKLDGTATVEIDGAFNLSNGYMVFTFVPDENCTSITYKTVEEDVFLENRFDKLPMKLAENIAADSYATVISDPTDATKLSGQSYYSRNSIKGSYVIALIKGKDDKFSTAYCKLDAAWYVTDTNLRKELLAFDKNGDNWLNAEEIDAATSLTLSSKTFTNMRGLSYLSKLETLEMTDVTGGQWLFGSLEEYREWKNPMPALKTLKIKNGEGVQLAYTNIALDLCPELETFYVDAWSSYSDLVKVDISKNTKLKIDTDNFYFPRSVREVVCNKDQEAKVKTVMADRLYDEDPLKVTVVE